MIDIFTLLYIKSITNNDLLHSTGSSTQYSAMTSKGTGSKRMAVCMCITDNTLLSTGS